MGSGINVSKGNGFAVIGPDLGLDVAKGLIYAVVSPSLLGVGIDAAKACFYAVLKPGPAGDFWPVILRMIDQQRS